VKTITRFAVPIFSMCCATTEKERERVLCSNLKRERKSYDDVDLSEFDLERECDRERDLEADFDRDLESLS